MSLLMGGVERRGLRKSVVTGASPRRAGVVKSIAHDFNKEWCLRGLGILLLAKWAGKGTFHVQLLRPGYQITYGLLGKTR